MPGQSILDDLIFFPNALMPALPDGYGPAISTARAIHSSSVRKLQLNAPFFVRGLSASQLETNWSVVCGILRANGLPLYATCQDLQMVPAAQVPARFAQRFLGGPLVHSEVMTADAFELVNSTESGSGWSWPYEIGSARDLKNLVSTLQAATGGEIPIGINLPLNAQLADVRMSLDSSADYLTLTYCPECLAASPEHVANLAAIGIVSARKLCAQFGRAKMPLMLDAPIVRNDHLVKLLALGATAINIESVVRNAMPAAEPRRYESKLTENLLGNLPSAQKVVRELPQVERALSELTQQLIGVLRFTGLLNVAELQSTSLKSLSRSVADQLGVAIVA